MFDPIFPTKSLAVAGKNYHLVIVKEVERLGVEEVVVTECGHFYATSRWEAPKWFDKPWKFRVRSILEVMDEYIRLGRIRLDRSRNSGISMTYHDSCNLGRNGGLFEEPRRILQACVKDLREMTPNRRQSICCGGGGGLVALPEYDEVRLKDGELKARQIRATGARAVVASCDNCRHQLGQLNEHYKLNVNVMGLAKLMANAIVPRRRKASLPPPPDFPIKS